MIVTLNDQQYDVKWHFDRDYLFIDSVDDVPSVNLQVKFLNMIKGFVKIQLHERSKEL